MCTVTYLPLNDKQFILTSSRDVGYKRAIAIPPCESVEKNISLLYPKDGEAGGTWIGSSRKNRLICLLNGGFENHKRKNSYAKSRGLIVKDLLIADSFESRCRDMDLKNIEPFTLVVVLWEKEIQLLEFVWDGESRHLKVMDQQPKIWSSSTLYTKDMQQKRRAWFKDWIERNELSKENILTFHKTAGVGDPTVDVFMSRKKVGTVSITQFEKKDDLQTMDYYPFSARE